MTMLRLYRFISTVALISVCLIGCAPSRTQAQTPAQVQAQTVHHRLAVTLDPGQSTLEVEDRLNLEGLGERILFDLRAGLKPRITRGRSRLTRLSGNARVERYALIPESGESEVTLAYGGVIRSELREVQESLGRSHQRSSGSISSQGVFLDGAAGWYPRVPDSLQSFEMRVSLPEGWLAVSQGAGPKLENSSVSWREDRPQDDIYLIAAPFELYRRDAGGVEAQVFLRRADKALAENYLAATARYLALYSGLLGDYPYAKFALVENFWDSGYGMPSFTLLGPRVIRLPFILHTSYPHEVLHNWWGNGVYVDYETGNWSEGLTTYLADHLLKERHGGGPHYRRDALQRYADYVREGGDFPLQEFRGRHSSASQSVGYGKGLMFFHMLRRELGDGAFIDGLRRFYRQHRFTEAGYEQLRLAFEQVSGRHLNDYFSQWLGRTGAPALAVSEVSVKKDGEGYRISGLLEQIHKGAPFRLQVPIFVHPPQGEPREFLVAMGRKQVRFEQKLSFRPVRLDVDPRFDLFRRLYAEESPPSFGALFGADQGLILLPGDAPEELLDGYRQLAAAWTRRHPDWRIGIDRDLRELPEDRPVWLLGWENRFLAQFRRRLTAAELGPDGIDLDGKSFARNDYSLALNAAGSDPRATPMAWLGAHDADALPGLARKLPHYGKYGALAFGGEAPDNRLKYQWPVLSSPLSVILDDAGNGRRVPPGPALSDVLKTGGE